MLAYPLTEERFRDDVVDRRTAHTQRGRATPKPEHRE